MPSKDEKGKAINLLNNPRVSTKTYFCVTGKNNQKQEVLNFSYSCCTVMDILGPPLSRAAEAYYFHFHVAMANLPSSEGRLSSSQVFLQRS